MDWNGQNGPKQTLMEQYGMKELVWTGTDRNGPDWNGMKQKRTETDQNGLQQSVPEWKERD